MKIIQFNDLFNKLEKWFDKDKRRLALFVIIFGFMVNILVITANIVFADSIVFTDHYVANVWDLSLGRWALHYFEGLRFGLSSSVVSTILSLIYLSVIIVMLIDLFKVKNKFFQYLFASISVVAPFFYETMFSVFCSSEFLMACLLATTSVFIIYNFKEKLINVLLASLALAVSLGLYQAHIGIATTLSILLPIVYLLKNEMDFKNVIKKFFLCLAMGILGVIFYEIILNIILHIWGVSLISYSGANEIGLKNLLMLPTLIVNSYQSFYNYFFTNNIINNLIYNRHIMHLILFLVLISAIVLLIWKNKKLNFKSIIFIIFCLIVSPICFGIVELIAPERDINQLMSSSFIIFYLFVLTLIDFKKFDNLKTIVNWVGVITCCAVFLTYFVMSNASFMAVRITKEKTINNISRIMDLILSNENYSIDMPVMFIGNGYSDVGYFKQSTNAVFNYSSGHTAESPLIWGGNVDNCNTGWQKLINYYLGTRIEVVDYETHMKILNTDEYKEMNVYPKQNSLKIIDGVMVVKLDDPAPTQQ